VLKAVQYLSPYKYSYEVLVANELVGLKTRFDPQGYDSIELYGEDYLANFGLPALSNDNADEGALHLVICSACWMVMALVVMAWPWSFPWHRLYAACGKSDAIPKADSAVKTPAEESSAWDRDAVELSWDMSTEGCYGISSGAQCGDLVAIVGKIGSGKTSLLLSIAGRIAGEGVTVCVNGKVMPAARLRHLVAFVPSDDCTYPGDTVRGALEFAAALSRKPMPEAPLLADLMDRQLKTLSGGQRKLVAVHVELARRPHALLLDEPLSSLDAETAFRLATLLKSVSKSIPVVMSLHQPRHEVCELLTHVILMDQGKAHYRVAYPDLAQKYQMPSSTVLEEALNDIGGAENLHSHFKAESNEPVPPPWEGLCLHRVLARECRRTWDLRGLMEAGLSIIVGILVGLAYRDMEKDVRGVLDRLGFFLVVMVAVGVFTIDRVFAFQRKKATALHELQSGVMSAWVFHLSQTLAELPKRLLSSGILAITLLLLVPLHEDANRRVAFFLFVVICGICSALLADACSALTSKAAAIFPGLLIVLLVLGGPFMDPDTDAGVVLQHFSYFRLIFSLLMSNELQGEDYAFDAIIAGVRIEDAVDVSGDEWLVQLNIDNEQGWHLLGLGLWSLLFWGIGVLGLIKSTTARPRFRPGVSV